MGYIPHLVQCFNKIYCKYQNVTNKNQLKLKPVMYGTRIENIIGIRC